MAAPARHGERLHPHAEPMLPDIYQPWPSPALAYPGPAGPAATASRRPGPAVSLVIPHLLVFSGAAGRDLRISVEEGREMAKEALTLAEVCKHNTKDDCWLIIAGKRGSSNCGR